MMFCKGCMCTSKLPEKALSFMVPNGGEVMKVSELSPLQGVQSVPKKDKDAITLFFATLFLC